MELKERTGDARAAYLEGYRDGEDHMQLRVFRILQKHMSTNLSGTAEDIVVQIHQDVARIPVQRNLQVRPHVIMEHGVRTSNVDLEKNREAPN